MKQLVLLVFLVFFAAGFSQETDPPKYGAGVFMSPDFAFPANTAQEARGYACYSAGAFFNARVGRKSRVGIGTTLSSRQILTEDVTFNSNYQPETGSFDTTFSYITDKQFLQIPVKWSRYFWQRERMGMYVTAGLSFNYQFREETRWRAHPESGERIKNYRMVDSDARIFGISPLIGGGIDFALTDRFLFAVQPEYAFYFLKDSDYTLQTLGIGFLLSYRW